MSSKITINGIDSAGEWTPLYTVPQSAPDKLREAARMALAALDAADAESVTKREFEARALMARDALREALGDEK